jgi:RNA recognition motif-containing protein
MPSLVSLALSCLSCSLLLSLALSSTHAITGAPRFAVQYFRPLSHTHAMQEYPVSLCNLFVGDLARTVTEEQIRDVFCRYGEIVKIDIKRDKVRNTS